MKGVSALVIAFIMLALVMGIGFMAYYATTLAVRVPPVTYDGEFDDGFLATKGWFTNDFTEVVDCNITSDVLGWKENASCVYQSTIAWNATAENSINSRDWYFAWVVDLDGPVKKMDVNFELSNKDTLQAADDAVIVDAKIYTHEDNPTLVFDLKPYIEDQVEIDATTGPLAGDEYVIWIHLRTKTVSPDAVTGDRIGVLNLKIDTTEDVDEAYATLISK
ncbi:MAG: hypothetical protein ACTSWZ_07760 [Candidatus Heimdallarchaeaceae archaeon]